MNQKDFKLKFKHEVKFYKLVVFENFLNGMPSRY